MSNDGLDRIITNISIISSISINISISISISIMNVRTSVSKSISDWRGNVTIGCTS